MTVIHSSVYSYSIDSMKKKIDDMVALGFNYKNVIEMTLKLPTLFGLSIDNIKNKKEFYDQIGLTDIMILKPKFIMQSVDLSYARYMFYKDKETEINLNNCTVLFMDQKVFIKKYGISNKELIEIYNYQEYIENNTKRKSNIK